MFLPYINSTYEIKIEYSSDRSKTEWQNARSIDEQKILDLWLTNNLVANSVYEEHSTPPQNTTTISIIFD
jgi:hypothetical protein